MRDELALLSEHCLVNALIQKYMTHLAANHAYLMLPDGTMPSSLTEWMKAYGMPNPDDAESQINFALNTMVGPGRTWSYMENALLPVAMALVRKHVRLLGADQMANDPYDRKIAITEMSSGRFSFGHDSFGTGEIAMYDTPEFGPYGLAIPRIAIYTETAPYPILREERTAWMTVTPTEVNSMRAQIADAAGRVLTLGLGMGYYAYMAHLKPDVESVTIVERSKDVIDMFSDMILPQFDHPGKIHIVQADAIEYLAGLQDGQFDYCFADIWTDCTDIDTYLRTKMAAKHLRKTKTSYWIEDEIIGLQLPAIAAAALGQDLDDMDLKEPMPMSHRRTVRLILEQLAKEPIETPEQLRKIFDIKNIIGLIDREDFIYKSPGLVKRAD